MSLSVCVSTVGAVRSMTISLLIRTATPTHEFIFDAEVDGELARDDQVGRTRGKLGAPRRRSGCRARSGARVRVRVRRSAMRTCITGRRTALAVTLPHDGASGCALGARRACAGLRFSSRHTRAAIRNDARRRARARRVRPSSEQHKKVAALAAKTGKHRSRS